ncbi:response regulator transcription factor [Brevundimonas goettingensis]|uniref:Response regulator transcription factor n=1 Tax=Brevundimonas goettingensis TaxID=2774190 RepID=A0A975C1X4_9CAUL|nr:response regulator transcription factor [Brevundimonas goettingensis]QTC89841.1 response regulator transcription factor [Brevundimonas goettingensis]
MKVAALDDDPVQLELILDTLSEAGLQGSGFSRANGLLSALRRETFDLLVLDWQLPDRSGLEVIRWAHSNLTPPPPILLVTSRSDDSDVVEGLGAGADDFLTKPVSRPVLKARIHALLRRAYGAPEAQALETHGHVVLDPATATATANGAPVSLTAKEFAVALTLFRNLNRALSRSYLLDSVWGSDPDLNSRTLDMHISRVRSKLNLRPDAGFRLAPVYSYGYRLERIEAAASTVGTADGET